MKKMLFSFDCHAGVSKHDKLYHKNKNITKLYLKYSKYFSAVFFKLQIPISENFRLLSLMFF